MSMLLVSALTVKKHIHYGLPLFYTGVLPDIERYFGIDDGKSGLLQTGGGRV